MNHVKSANKLTKARPPNPPPIMATFGPTGGGGVPSTIPDPEQIVHGDMLGCGICSATFALFARAFLDGGRRSFPSPLHLRHAV